MAVNNAGRSVAERGRGGSVTILGAVTDAKQRPGFLPDPAQAASRNHSCPGCKRIIRYVERGGPRMNSQSGISYDNAAVASCPKHLLQFAVDQRYDDYTSVDHA